MGFRTSISVRAMKSRPTILLVVSLASLGCRENFEFSYATMDDVRAHKEQSLYWLPTFMPADARNIRECHNIDSNEGWSTFEFPPSNLRTWQSQLTTVAPEKLSGLTVRAPATLTWWPAVLKGRLDSEKLRASGLRFSEFRAEPNVVFIAAVDVNEGRAFVWRRRTS